MINFVPIMRVTPAAGLQKSYALTSIVHLTRAAVFYDRSVLEREFVDRSVGEADPKYLVRAELEFIIPQTPSADQATLIEILSYMADDQALVELSMGNDGFGIARYREVAKLSETQEYPHGPLSIERRAWSIICANTLSAPIPPGLGAVAQW